MTTIFGASARFNAPWKAGPDDPGCFLFGYTIKLDSLSSLLGLFGEAKHFLVFDDLRRF